MLGFIGGLNVIIFGFIYLEIFATIYLDRESPYKLLLKLNL